MGKTVDQCKALFMKQIKYAAPDFLRSMGIVYSDEMESIAYGDAVAHAPSTVLDLPRGAEICQVEIKCEVDKKVKSLEFFNKTGESLGKIEAAKSSLAAVKLELAEDEHIIDLHLM